MSELNLLRHGRTAILIGLLLGCGDTVSPYEATTSSDAASRYWTLTFDHTAVTLSTVAPYDTAVFVATARDGHGAPLTGLGPIKFTSSDPARVEITPDGVVHAHETGDNVQVTAELAVGNVRHTASAFITITNDSAPPVLAHLSIQPLDGTTFPVSGDGSFLSISPGKFSNAAVKIWFLQGTDADSVPIPGVLASCVSSDSMIASVGCIQGGLVLMFAKKAGRVTINASATAYGVTQTDSVTLTITPPAFGIVWIEPHVSTLNGAAVPAFIPASTTVVPGSTVIWGNIAGQPSDIVFDDPTNVLDHGTVSCAAAGAVDPGGVGNVPAFGEPQDMQAPSLNSENCRSRSFPTAGVYTYHSTLTQATGKIIVTNDVPAQ